MVRGILLFHFLVFFFGINGQSISFIQNEEGVLLTDEHPVYFYQAATKSINGKYARANYIHPLYNLNGDTLTQDFPSDHLHQRGIFWAWHQLYAGSHRLADSWMCDGIEWQNDTIITRVSGNSAIMESHVLWVITNNLSIYYNTPVVKEKVIITYNKVNKFAYELDFNITLYALIDSLFIGGSEDIKGYGGFSVRLKTNNGLSFKSDNKEIIPENTPVMAGDYIDVSGIDNHSVSIFCHPDELPEFKGWILRSEKSMQNIAFPGRDLLFIPKDKPLNFRNKIVVKQDVETK